MNLSYRKVAQRLQNEIPHLEQTVGRITQAWQTLQSGEVDEGVYLDSVALNLHSFYSGVERLLELIAHEVDQSPPSGDTWHHTLLTQMAVEFPPYRPAVISQASYAGLDECRRFRHLVRNIYALHLQPDRMRLLIENLPLYWPTLQAELLAFADLLEQLAATPGE